MSQRARHAPLRAVVGALVATIAVAGLAMPGAAAGTDDAAPPAPSTTVANEFVPERDLSECISSIPKPDCGSKARGGWRQAIVFVVMLVAMAAIGLRIAFGIRRRDRALGAAEPGSAVVATGPPAVRSGARDR